MLSIGRKEVGSGWTQGLGSASAASSVFIPSNAVRALRQRSMGAQALLSGGHSEMLWSSYKPVTRSDSNLLLR